MGMEKREFQIDKQKAMTYLATRQAGELSKACLEGVMNSIDAGATRCEISVDSRMLKISDNGRGFSSLGDIDKLFGTFAWDHDTSEKKVYGEFGLGRGQMLYFGPNVWYTKGFKIQSDFMKEQTYGRGESDRPYVDGCVIEITLNKRLLPSEIIDLKNGIKKMVRYVPIAVKVNGETVSTNPAEQKWDYDTPDAWIKLRETGDVDVYNLGVFVRGYSNHQYGTGAVVVSKKQLRMNLSRNDVMVNECGVWKRIRKFLNRKATEANLKFPAINGGDLARGRKAASSFLVGL